MATFKLDKLAASLTKQSGPTHHRVLRTWDSVCVLVSEIIGFLSMMDTHIQTISEIRQGISCLMLRQSANSARNWAPSPFQRKILHNKHNTVVRRHMLVIIQCSYKWLLTEGSLVTGDEFGNVIMVQHVRAVHFSLSGPTVLVLGNTDHNIT